MAHIYTIWQEDVVGDGPPVIERGVKIKKDSSGRSFILFRDKSSGFYDMKKCIFLNEKFKPHTKRGELVEKGFYTKKNKTIRSVLKNDPRSAFVILVLRKISCFSVSKKHKISIIAKSEHKLGLYDYGIILPRYTEIWLVFQQKTYPISF